MRFLENIFKLQSKRMIEIPNQARPIAADKREEIGEKRDCEVVASQRGQSEFFIVLQLHH